MGKKTKYKHLFLVSVLAISILFVDGKALAEEYEYDDLNRIVRITYEDGSYVEYEYDKNGNILKTVVSRNNEESRLPEETTLITDTENSSQEIPENESKNHGEENEREGEQKEGVEESKEINDSEKNGEDEQKESVEESKKIDDSKKNEGEAESGETDKEGSGEIFIDLVEIFDIVAKKAIYIVMNILDIIIEAFRKIFG